MRLIAKKPCSFGGKKFFIGEEVPAGLVADPASQEKMGVLAIAKGENEEMLAASVGTLLPVDCEGVITVSVNGENDGEMLAILVTTEEIQQVFSIMQLNADEGTKAISEVESENVLILLHAADSRKTIKEAAKKQADNLFSIREDLNEASTGNATTATNTEGADT